MRLNLVNAVDAGGQPLRLSIEGAHIAATAVAGPSLDMAGARLLPGLVNAHDHLQLNAALPRLKFRASYRNASEWIADVTPRISRDPCLLEHRAAPRAQRSFMGGLKNLLSGVTTVAHHDPRGAELDIPGFPVDVPELGGWSHSLAMDGEVAVRESRRAARPDKPWIIHAAEGIDGAAAQEFDRLEALGCIAPGTLLVHGLGLTAAQQRRLIDAGAGLVWCPGSNLHMFGSTLDPELMFAAGRLALGSDSRISGERDLLAELALARELTGWGAPRLESWVTEDAARLLGLRDRGRLEVGLRADLIALPPELPLADAARADLRLVVVAGRPLYADAQLGAALGLAPVIVDGQPKALARHLVAALRATRLQEPGLDLVDHSEEAMA
ncbi:amidohydrolase family protein [Roseateles saccharophilus]|uniref:Cytosine/adenosine deaminase-related metal-dependent hydrolase n=1 Tax=Roseateles saccharophilus TaxID=304 RepID=A0A4R3U7A8_ROSSA|nr:amidohydrolase family protein [Roseateles saccharophilus]MDG0836198.1 amidohydrolase [Roseateles saccharophilus]TCU82726.1 cytosine/adenosine deaminase-related metal-dependent hydrolase [Roseateles saccharophilus]